MNRNIVLISVYLQTTKYRTENDIQRAVNTLNNAGKTLHFSGFRIQSKISYFLRKNNITKN